ncbi:Galactose-6-phosphate isomerase subunit LacB 1, partial [Clarias magur]
MRKDRILPPLQLKCLLRRAARLVLSCEDCTTYYASRTHAPAFGVPVEPLR